MVSDLVDLPSGAKFCLERGTQVPTAIDRESRRTVMLLFTDMSASTALGEQLDPEVYRGVMGRYFAIAPDAIEKHGGLVEKFVGDAVLAVFGVPGVHEDDALRAVRAADELTDAVAVLSEELQPERGVRLAIRPGVNTGSVVTGSAWAGEILLGAPTYALVRDAVEMEVLMGVTAKGKAGPVPAFRLLRVLDALHWPTATRRRAARRAGACVPLLAARQIAVLGSDGNGDTAPSLTDGVDSPYTCSPSMRSA